MANPTVQAFVDGAEQALADLRAEAADARQRGLEALVALGERAAAQLEGDDDAEPDEGEPTAEQLPAEPEA